MAGKRDKARRWWQIGIRDLLLCTVIVALATGWAVDSRRQGRAIEDQGRAIEDQGRTIERQQVFLSSHRAERAAMGAQSVKDAELFAQQADAYIKLLKEHEALKYKVRYGDDPPEGDPFAP